MASPNPDFPQTFDPAKYTIRTITPQDLQEQLQTAQAHREAAPSDAEARYQLGFALALLDEDEEAETEYREALRLDPDHADAHLGLGMLLDDRSDVEAAASEYAAAVRLNPDLDDARLYLGDVLSQLGREAEARREWAEVVEINKRQFPRHAPAELSKIQTVREALERLADP